MAINTPMKINTHGNVPPITPSTTIFISVACGAGICSEPNPHAELRRYITPPIAKADTIAPINSPICCNLGVAPTM